MFHKIITKGKYQWNDKTNQFDTIYEDSFDYDGDIAYAKAKAPDGKKMGKEASDDFDDAFKPTFEAAGKSLRKKILSEGKKAALGFGGSFAAAITSGAQVAFDVIEKAHTKDFGKIMAGEFKKAKLLDPKLTIKDFEKVASKARTKLKAAATDMTQVLEGGLTGASDSFDLRNAAKEFGKALEVAGFTEEDIKKRLAPIYSMADKVELKEMEKNFTDSLESSVMAGLGFIPKNAFTEALGMDSAMKTVSKEFADHFKEKGAKVGAWMKENWGKALAIGVVAGISVGIYKGLKKAFLGFAEIVDTLGGAFGQAGAQSGDLQTNLRAARIEAIGIGGSIDDVVDITTGLSDEFGIGIDGAAEMSASILDSSKAMGLGASEGATLFGTFMKLGQMSPKIAESTAETTYNLAKANKVNPAAVMKDISESTEYFAKFGHVGAVNIGKAAIQAKKLGLSLDDVAGIATSLLDFESSITAELEASMMIGRQINMQRARQLALDDDHEGMMKEVMKQVGGIAKWEQLRGIQKQSFADMLGVEVGVMNKLALGAADLSELTKEQKIDLEAQKAMSSATALMSKFKQMGAVLIDKIGAPLESLFGRFSDWLTTVDEKGTSPFERIGEFIAKIGNNIGGWAVSIEAFFTKNDKGISGFTEMLDTIKGIIKATRFWATVTGTIWLALNGLDLVLKVIAGTKKAITTIMTLWANKQKIGIALTTIWNALMAASPIGLIVASVMVVVGLVGLLIKHWDKILPAIKKVGSFLWDIGAALVSGLKAIGKTVLDILIWPWMQAWEWITGLFGGESPSALGLSIVEGIASIGTMMLDFITWPFRTAMNFIGNLFGIDSLGDNIIQPIKNVFLSAVDWISKIWSSVIDILKAPFNFIIKGINWMIRGINSISIDIPEMLGGGTFGFNIPEIPSLQTVAGETKSVKSTGIATVHAGEAVMQKSDLAQVTAELRAQTLQIRRAPEADFTPLIAEVKAMGDKIDAGNTLAQNQITKQDELFGFGGSATKAIGREQTNRLMQLGGSG